MANAHLRPDARRFLERECARLQAQRGGEGEVSYSDAVVSMGEELARLRALEARVLEAGAGVVARGDGRPRPRGL